MNGMMGFHRPGDSDQVVQAIPGVLETVARNYEAAEQALRGLFGLKYRVDEMALWFPNAQLAYLFASRMVRKEGFTIFNSAEDHVDVEPIPSLYGVEYLFLSTPDNYRLELMNLRYGFSPYHSFLEAATTGEHT